MPGIGDEMEGAIQHAPHPGRQLERGALGARSSTGSREPEATGSEEHASAFVIVRDQSLSAPRLLELSPRAASERL
ncbi:MAG TPA: hypothetical protein VKY73_12670, partial [Polyangiaceae bacterium]|nr:hypothetical protein [Polyangiaceae bacterium]